jgi:hypothetical protein
MTGKFKHTTALTLLLVFLMPSLLKLEHHHDHEICDESIGGNMAFFHEKCLTCSFEFSVFTELTEKFDFRKEDQSTPYCKNYKSVTFSNLTHFLFLLRAPPLC